MSPRVFNRRTRRRFNLDRHRFLVGHLGREPTYPERLIISRIASLEWWLQLLDSRLDEGKQLSGHDIRGRLAAETRLMRDLQALGLPPRAVQQMTVKGGPNSGHSAATGCRLPSIDSPKAKKF